MDAINITPAIWKRLVDIVRRRTSRHIDAEDYVQSGYQALIEESTRQVIANPQGFVLRAATNLAIADFRKAKRHKQAHEDDAIAALLHPIEPTQHEVIVARARLQAVQEAIDHLSPKAREVFLLHRIDGLSYSKIAELKGISVSGVEKHMARSLAHLANRLKQLGVSRD